MNDETPMTSDAPGGVARIGPDGWSARLAGSAPRRARPRLAKGGDSAQTAAASAGIIAPLDAPGVSVPDVAFQFKPCLSGIEATIMDAIRSGVPGAADVRVQCFKNTERVAIWMRPPEGADDGPARDAAVQSLELLGPGENYAAFINASLIRSQADDAFAKQPKRLTGDGVPGASGAVHLTGLRLNFQAPNRVNTIVDGFDERPWPDVDFHLIATDTLSASAGELQSHSDHNIDTDTGWLTILTAAMNALTVLVSGWFLPLALLFFYEGVTVASADPPDTGAGAGAAAIGALPTEIMIPEKLKVAMHYERVQVSEGGIFTGGFIVLAQRTPALAINGARLLAAKDTLVNVNRSYSVATADLRGPLSFHWTADGIVGRPHDQSTGVTFHLKSPKVGQVLAKNVHVQVTDVDGLTAEESITVQLHIVSGDPDNNLPPICRIKPWLPVCKA